MKLNKLAKKSNQQSDRAKGRYFVAHWKSGLITLAVVVTAVIAGGITMGMHPNAMTEKSDEANITATRQPEEPQNNSPEPKPEHDPNADEDNPKPISSLPEPVVQGLTTPSQPQAKSQPSRSNNRTNNRAGSKNCDHDKKQSLTKDYNNQLQAENERFKSATQPKSMLSRLLGLKKFNKKQYQRELAEHHSINKNITTTYQNKLRQINCM